MVNFSITLMWLEISDCKAKNTNIKYKKILQKKKIN